MFMLKVVNITFGREGWPAEEFEEAVSLSVDYFQEL